MEQEAQKYRMICTLTFGDIYGQIIVWLIVIFLSLASALALWSTTRQIYALATVGIVLVLSLPFLLFAFVTTLLNHIEFTPIEQGASTRQFTPGGTLKATSQKSAQAAG
ncbi:hypothetical protein [Gloeothece verrucosa]|uniref:Uncharacterized protein n=1 Tax=Gloeothece verrucosa (strain PCC 7822) TaxID=497965 RepID=E0U634_GLOV7|nr:hypothetical protein [Gloeothece verrucosa]ADN17143.1 conserved hypothetical protein [Gloeothece verrucosa PCC 7822]